MAQLMNNILIILVMAHRVSLTRTNEQTNPQQQQQPLEPTLNLVRVVEAPAVLGPDSRVLVQYQCEDDAVVVVDFTVMPLDSDKYVTVFSRSWRCKGQGSEGQPKTKSVRLRLPASLLYRPDFFNEADVLWMVNWSKVRVWLVDRLVWSRQYDGDSFGNAKGRDFFKVFVLPPYSRPFKQPRCTVWIWEHIQRLPAFSDRQTCPAEKEFVTLLNYPVAFNGYAYSIVRELSPFKAPELENDRKMRLHSPQLTIELWLYVVEYCPMYYMSPAETCGLFLHMDRQGRLYTPSLLINKHGNIQIDVKGANGYIAMKSTDVIPRNRWTRLVFTLSHRTWLLHVNHGPGLKDGFWTTHTYSEDIFVDDTEGLLSIGGIDWTMGTFVGYMGRVTYHRRRTLSPSKLSLPSTLHPMFELHLTRRKEKCENFLSWMDSAVDVYQRYRRFVLNQRPDICPHLAYLLFAKYLSQPEDVTTCPTRHPHVLRNHRHVSRLLQKVVSSHSLSKNFLHGDLEAYSRSFKTEESRNVFHNISVGLIENATEIVRVKGLRYAGRVVHLLRQAACLGNDDAMYSLAVMLNNGVGCAPDELQSLAFFMLGTLNRHVFSVMALGHRHTMGIDGAPVDKDVAYMYYKQVADRTRADKESHKESDIATESIRLIDEARIDAQTSELGDLFLWLKHQAEKGVASAQSQLGAMLYHGAQGLNRNLQSAVNVFREGAESGNVDAMFNYGLMQYRGLGTEANKTEGRMLLQKAADLKNPNAVSALGWLAMEVDKNYTLAYNMFLLAKKLDHMDSGYYLGHMFHFGFVPDSPVDLDRALEEYFWSAKKAQIDSGNIYAFLLSRGTPKYKRNSQQAGEWARFIAEKNSGLAKPLRDAINAYRDDNHELAMYFYLLLADTGLEVASFNLAYLCEQNKDGLRTFISKDCEFRHYNLTVQREFHFVDTYSFLKMGDYSWYGCQEKRDLRAAAYHYSYAAVKGSPQALFNLAYMVEEDIPIDPGVWFNVNIRPHVYKNKVALLLELYSRCRESRQSEAFMPCCLAWFRIWFLDIWDTYNLYMKITSFLGVLITVAASIFMLYNSIRQRRVQREEAAQREADQEAERKLLDEAQVI